MARVYTKFGFEFHEIQSEEGRFRMTFVPELGGIGVSLVYKTAHGEKEMLWMHEKFWQGGDACRYGGWPFLFPICGRLERDGIAGAYLYRGDRYLMPIHGVACRQAWRVASEDAHSIRLVLTDSGQTRHEYPFSFEVSLAYRLTGEGLTCEQTYRNTGEHPMPYYAGFHPYFATPRSGEGKEQCRVEFNPEHRYLYNERLTDLTGSAPVLKFPCAVTEPAINEQLHRLPQGINESRLIIPGAYAVTMSVYGREDASMFPFIQLFTQKEHPFFCIEPWMGAPNTLNTVEGARWLAPGAEESGVLHLNAASA